MYVQGQAQFYLYIIGWIWTTRIILAILWLIQLTGNGLVIWLLLFKTELRKSNYFILALAISDFLSALGGSIGAYREDLGRQQFHIPFCFQYVYVIIEMLTTFITWNLISSFALIRIGSEISGRTKFVLQRLSQKQNSSPQMQSNAPQSRS